MRKIYQFANPIRMVEGRYGHMVYNQHCHWVGKALETYGEYCQHEIELFKLMLKPEDTVWEIGANTGSQSPALAQCVSKGRYLGFEPQIELYKIFVTNLTLNNCANATPYNFALGDQDGIIELPAINYHVPNNFGGVSLLAEAPKAGHKVEVRRIDGLDWLPPPNFIKMDVEGMETMVLRGGANTIAQHQPIMYIENDRIEKSPDLIQALWDMGYTLYWHLTPYFSEGNFFGYPSNIYGNVMSINMVCLHRDKKIGIQGLELVSDKFAHPMKAP